MVGTLHNYASAIASASDLLMNFVEVAAKAHAVTMRISRRCYVAVVKWPHRNSTDRGKQAELLCVVHHHLQPML